MGILVAAFALLAGAGWQTDDALTVAAVRFFSPASGTTTIEGTCQIRLSAPPGGSPGAIRYRVEVAVRDSAGLELRRDAWNRELPAGAARRGASAVESFTFGAAAGRYRVTVRVVPEGGSSVERELVVHAFAQKPAVSDLLIASEVRRPASDSEALEPGEVRRAGLAMRTAPSPRISPTEPTLAYYAELYPWQAAGARGELRAEVVGENGRVIVTTPARPVEVAAAGGVTRGSLDLTGLPAGEYRLRLRVRLDDSSVVVEAPFAMGSLAAALAQAVPAPVPRGEDVLFDGRSETQLDSLFAPMTHIVPPEELSVYGTLATEGRRRFLKAFWQRRDPTPQTPDNPAMHEYYRAVTYTNEAFREPGAGGIAGWRTDRGRIYLRNGRPDDVLRRPSASPRPYEVWKFTRDRVRYFVFYDQSGFGNYRLIGTNDTRETGVMDWERYLGPEGSQDVMQFIR